ncbi:transposase [Streptosporangium sp. NPDC003464]
MARVDGINADIATLDHKITQQISPFTAAVERLGEVSGIGLITTHAIIAEIGLDMSRFPTAAHLTSWTRFAPGVK